MALEAFGFIDDLDINSPAATDVVSQGDDHIRGVKNTLTNTFLKSDGTTKWDKAINADPEDVSYGTVPVGGAIIWTGTIAALSASPFTNKKWALMNGTANSTGSGINLTGKFVVFADSDAGGTLDVGDTGGQSFSSGVLTSTSNTTGATSASHSLTEAELPSHSHLVANNGEDSDSPSASIPLVTNYNSGTFNTYTLKGKTGGVANVFKSSLTGSGDAHSHTFSDPGHTHTITPPYYALAYIERLPNA